MAYHCLHTIEETGATVVHLVMAGELREPDPRVCCHCGARIQPEKQLGLHGHGAYIRPYWVVKYPQLECPNAP